MGQALRWQIARKINHVILNMMLKRQAQASLLCDLLPLCHLQREALLIMQLALIKVKERVNTVLA